MPKASPPIPPAHPAPASYEAALKELEALVADMEAGQLPLAQLLMAYCRAQLDAVEQQIKVLDNGALKSWTTS